MRTPDRRSFDAPRRGQDRDAGFGGAAAGPVTGAVVKWFNPEKGFGFVEVESGGDAFLHVSALTHLGLATVQPGAAMQVRTGAGQKGLQVTEVVSVEAVVLAATGPLRSGLGGPLRSSPGGPLRSSPAAVARSGTLRAPREAPDMSTAVEMRATVKWFNPDKGFGFATPEGGGRDVFVHISVLASGGLATLEPNQVVRMQVAEGRRGPEAVTVEIA